MEAKHVNRLTLVGLVGEDPVFSGQISGREIAAFKIGTRDRWVNQKGESAILLEMHQIVTSGPHLELVKESVRNNCLVMVEGKVTYREWVDQDGDVQMRTEIAVHGPNSVLNVLAPPRAHAALAPALGETSGDAGAELEFVLGDEAAIGERGGDDG